MKRSNAFALGIDGIRFYANPHPGKLYVVEGPDRVGKSTIAESLAMTLQLKKLGYGTGASMEAKQLLHSFLDTDVAFENPAMVQEAFNVVRHQGQAKIEKVLASGTSVLLDRNWLSMLVYGQVAGLELDYLLSNSRHFIVPDAILLVTRKKPLPGREEKRNKYDDDLEFLSKVTRLYYWLLEWWKQHVPTIPIGMVELDGCDIPTSLKRAERRFLQLISDSQ